MIGYEWHYAHQCVSDNRVIVIGGVHKKKPRLKCPICKQSIKLSKRKRQTIWWSKQTIAWTYPKMKEQKEPSHER